MIQEHNDLLFAGLPADAEKVQINILPGLDIPMLAYCTTEINGRNAINRQLPPGYWELIGIHPGLTEEQAAQCVESDSAYGPRMYRDYSVNSMPYYQESLSALESLSSLMDHLKLYTVNPYGEEQRSYSELADGVDRFELAEDMQQRQEAQSRTFPLWAVLKRKTK